MRFLIAVIFLVSISVNGAVLNSNGTASDTQTQINSVSTGDIVRILTTDNYTWSSDVTIPDTKGITLDLNNSQITISGSGIELAINSPTSGSTYNCLTNGTIINGGGHSAFTGIIQILDTRNGAGIKVCNIAFQGDNVLVDVNCRGKGVMHNCTFTSMDGAQEMLHGLGWGAADATGWTTDSSSVLQGSENLFYIEDCYFQTTPTALNASFPQFYYGSRVGIRSNYFSYVTIDVHGTAGAIGGRWWEAYNNRFVNESGDNHDYAFSFRAGSGVIFGNTAADAVETLIIGLCEEDSSYPEDYQIGRGLNQASDPAYVWSNTSLNLAVDSCDAVEVAGMVQVGRDVFESTKSGYTSYTYPHPFRGASASALEGKGRFKSSKSFRRR